MGGKQAKMVDVQVPDGVEEGEEEEEEDNDTDEEVDEEEEEEEEEEEDKTGKKLPTLRSKNSHIMSEVTFKSRSMRRVDLFWVNFKGKRVKCATLDPGQKFDVNTFVTHPWVFRDARTGMVLHADGKETFMPEENQHENQRHSVIIHTPVYRLLDRCVEVCSQVFDGRTVCELEVPVCLQMDFLMHQMNKNIPCSLHKHYQSAE